MLHSMLFSYGYAVFALIACVVAPLILTFSIRPENTLAFAIVSTLFCAGVFASLTISIAFFGMVEKLCVNYSWMWSGLIVAVPAVFWVLMAKSPGREANVEERADDVQG